MKKTPLVALALVVGLAGAVTAQQTGFTRTPLQTQDLSIAGKQLVQARAEFQPGIASGRHTHPGEEAGYVLEGQVQITIDGKPAMTLKAGDAFFIPAKAVHEGKNVGTGVAKILGTYVIEKGQPLSTPVK